MRIPVFGRKLRATHVAIAVVLLAPAAALLTWDEATEAPVDERNGTIIDIGYHELVPPSTIHLPGTINTVEIRSDGSVQLHPTCRMDRDALAAAMEQSSTASLEHAKRFESGFEATAALPSTAESTAVGEKVRSVRVSLRDARILSMPDETLLEIQKQYIKDTCQEAIMHNLSAGARVCQTEEVLQADAVYRIDYQDETATDQKVEAAQAVAVSLGLSADASEVEEIRGDDLFFGVKLKRFCIVQDGNQPQAAPPTVALFQ